MSATVVKICPRELPLKQESEFLEIVEKDELTTKDPQPGTQNIALNEGTFYTASAGQLFASPPPNSTTSIRETSTWTIVNDATVHESKTDIQILEKTLVCADEPTVTSADSTLVGEDITSSSACGTSLHDLIAVEKASRYVLAEGLNEGPSETPDLHKTFKLYVQQQTIRAAQEVLVPAIAVHEFIEPKNTPDRSLMPFKSNPIDGSAKFKEETAPQAMKEEKIASRKQVVEEVALNSQELARMFKIGLFEGKTMCPAKKIQNLRTSRKTPERCTNVAGAKKRERALEILNNIARMGFQPLNRRVVQKLQELALELICRKYHRDQMEDIAKGWASSLFDLSTPAKIAGAGIEECSVQDLTYAQSTRESGSQAMNSVQETLPGTVNFLFATLSRCFNAPPIFFPYKSKLRGANEARKHLQAIIEKDLTRSDLFDDGYIYVYRSHGSFGHIKIGCTTRPVNVRLQEWRNQCGHDLVIEYPKPETMQRHRHIKRLEAIVHTELQDHRRIEPRCRKCYRQHKEWFEEALANALNVIAKWSDWMKQEPYEVFPVGEKTDSKGRVVREWRGRLKENHAAALPSMLHLQAVRQQLAPPPSPAHSRRRSLSPNLGRRPRSPRERRYSSSAPVRI